MPDIVYVAQEASGTTRVIGVYRTLDGAKLAIEATHASGIWQQDDADAWTFCEYHTWYPEGASEPTRQD